MCDACVIESVKNKMISRRHLFKGETMLLENTNARGLAVDALSLDYGQSADFATHYAWLPQDRWGLENVANLDKLPASGATIIVGAPKFMDGTGGQCRLFAIA